jgi:hypothetical protein
MKYWIVVVSKDHIARGVEGGFMQANHGKEGSLKRMAPGDGVIFYSPKTTFMGSESLQAFTAIGEVADDKIYQHKMADNFIPYRRNIKFRRCKDASIAPLIPGEDYELIRGMMVA